MESILQLTRKVVSSRLGQFLFVTHLILVIYAFGVKSTADFGQIWNDCATLPIAGRAIRIPFESPLLKTLALLDLPSLFIYYVIGLLIFVLIGLIAPNVSAYTVSWIGAVILLLLTSVQWLLIGSFIEWLIRRMMNRK